MMMCYIKLWSITKHHDLQSYHGLINITFIQQYSIINLITNITLADGDKNINNYCICIIKLL